VRDRVAPDRDLGHATADMLDIVARADGRVVSSSRSSISSLTGDSPPSGARALAPIANW